MFTNDLKIYTFAECTVSHHLLNGIWWDFEVQSLANVANYHIYSERLKEHHLLTFADQTREEVGFPGVNGAPRQVT
jgi:hypothetical protein